MEEIEQTGAEAGASNSGSEKAPEETAEAKDRKALADKLAGKGREAKAAQARADAAEAERDALREERDQLRYEHKMTDAEKEEFRASRTAAKKQKDDPEKTNLVNENALLKAIAAEDNPAAKKALTKMLDKASTSGRYPDAAAVAAIRESFESDGDEDDKKPDAKVPPKVTASGGHNKTPVSLDEEIKEVTKKIRAGKATTADLYPLLQRRDAEKAAARA